MEQVNAIIEFLYHYSHHSIFIYPVIGVLLLYFLMGKKDELGRLALDNTKATVLLYGVNCLIAYFFHEQIFSAFDTVYSSLHIPAIDRAFWSGTPVLVLALISIVANDFLGYWSHRLMHTKWVWPTHAAHHSDTYVNGFTTFRVHYLEVVLVMASQMLFLTWLGLPEMLPVVAIFHMVHNVYVHQDLDWGHGPLRHLIASPRYHRWHHADVPEAHGKNLANVIPLWDVLFGTYYVPGVCREQMGALASGVEDTDARALVTYPFRTWARMMRPYVTRASSISEPETATKPAGPTSV